MLEEASQIMDLEVFTPWGVRVGQVTNLEIDDETQEISNLFLEQTNEKLVENGASIMVPFRWIMALGDVVILRFFPKELPIKGPEDLGLEEYQG